MNREQTILLIDDKPANLFALEQLLESPGRTFLKADNGKEGLTLALNEKVDLIILDVQMPDMDGFEVAQILKSSKRTKDIPIIFASAEKKERNFIIQGFDEGAVDYLSKPLDPDLTKAKVAVLLKIQLQKRELIEKNIALEKAEGRIKDLNADLQKNLDQLEDANKELESFSYSVSHDLRSPIRSLLGFSEILDEQLKESSNPTILQALDRIRINADKMNQMINDLLEFSRLGRQEVAKSSVDMNEIVTTVLTDIGNTGNARIDVHPVLPGFADTSLITHVWMNLISNAVKYSSKNSHPVIEITSTQADQEIIYSVKDNGAGFDMDYANKLFAVFQRLHTVKDFPGTGVGLAIAARIVARHGGRIWAEAKIGEGAQFYFALPQQSS